jgi:hypothetical protein
MLPQVQRVWGNERSHSQGNSHVRSCNPERTPKFSECDCKGQNSSPWKVLYIIGNLLKCRCLKWAHIAHLDIYNTSYGQRKDQESNWHFDPLPLKVRNRPDSLACRQRATYYWKDLDKCYNFISDLIAIGGLHKMLCALKVVGIPTVILSRLPTPKTKNHLDMAPVERCRVYYKGEGGSFPQVWAMVSLMCLNC